MWVRAQRATVMPMAHPSRGTGKEKRADRLVLYCQGSMVTPDTLRDIRTNEINERIQAMQIDTLSRPSEQRSYRGGEIIFREGEAGHLMYIIVSGSADVRISDTRIATLGAGSIVGEMALIDGAPRCATVVARDGCVLAPINREQFEQFQAANPQFSARLLQVMVGRLRNLQEQVIRNALLAQALADDSGAAMVQETPSPRLRLNWRPARSGRGLEMVWSYYEANQ